MRRLPIVFAAWLLGISAFAEHPPTIPDWVKEAANQKIDVPADSKAVVLLDDEALELKENGETFTHQRRVVKILRPEGREDYGDVSVPFDKERKLLSLHAWSISAKGEQYEVKDKDFLERSAYNEELYSDMKIRGVIFPAAGVGAVVAYEFVQRDRPFMFTDEWNFQEQVPVKHSIYTLTIPPAWEYQVKWLRHEAIAPLVTGNTYKWEIRDVPALEYEPSMPSRGALVPRMVVSYFGPAQTASFNSWANIGKWYSALTADRRILTPEITALAQQLSIGKQTYWEKVSAAAAFMQTKIRYVAIEIGIGGFQPHTASDIFQRKYGDCKDKATLMSTLLKQMGVDSHYLLVHTRRGVVSEELPSTRFNHVILAIDVPADFHAAKAQQAIVTAKDGKRYLIFDPTDEFTPIGMINGNEQESYALLVLEGNGEALHLPLLAPETNELRRTAKFKLESDGSLTGEVTEYRTGYHARSDRYGILHASDLERRQHVEKFLGSFLAGAVLSGLTYEHLNDYDQPLIVKYMVKSQSYAKHSGPLILVRARVLGSNVPEFGPPPRKNPFAFHSASRMVDEYDIEFPSSWSLDELPDPTHLDLDFASYNSKTEVENKVLHYRREYIVRKVQIDKEKLGEMQRLASTINADERSSAVLKAAQ